jgi:hypothetical protein
MARRLAHDDRGLEWFEPERDERRLPPTIFAALMLAGALAAIAVFHSSVIALL